MEDRNTLVKLVRAESQWVPPVTRTWQERVVTYGGGGYTKLLRTKTSQVLPAGWRAELWWPSPDHWPVTYIYPSTRFVNGTLEVWSREGPDPYYTIRVYGPDTTNQAVHTSYVTRTEVLVAGYWLTQEDDPKWDAGARSAASARGVWELSFRVPRPPKGVVVGIASHPTDPTRANSNIVHGFYIRGDDVLIWNSSEGAQLPAEGAGGVTEFSRPPVRTEAVLFKLVGNGGVVSFFADGQLIAQTRDLTFGSDVFMAAALYGATDAVTEPTFKSGALSGAGSAKFSMLVRGGELDATGRAVVTLQASGRTYHNRAYLPGAVRAVGSAVASGGRAIITAKPRAVGYGVPGISGSGAVALTPAAIGHAYDGGFGHVRFTPLVRVIFDDGVVRSLPEMVSVVDYLDPAVREGKIVYEAQAVKFGIKATKVGAGSVPTQAKLLTSANISRLLRATTREVVGISYLINSGAVKDVSILQVVAGGQEMTIAAVIDMPVVAGLTGDAGVSAGNQLEAVLREVLNMGEEVSLQALLHALVSEVLGVTVVKDFGAPSAVWCVVNSGSDDEGSTSYTAYPFTSFANIGGTYFGASVDGLYRLGGDSDAGAPIEAVVDFGQRDFGSKALKSLSYAYVSTNAELPLNLAVQVGDERYTYAARSSSPEMRTQRIDLGRGLRAHFFGLRLTNKGGAAFETDGLEFAAQESNRRI